MQGIHSIGGGRFLTGGGDRRLRPHHQAALKCPRCDSLNTKFCYYNNYNLSQPRHFCKSCRRYWTKGGVLRNVPVGGGCRKSKRSKPKTDGERKPNRSSSSESSSLTAATTAGAAEEGALPTNMVHEFADPSKFLNTLPLDHHQSTMDGQIFTNEMMGYGMGADVKTTSYQGTGLVGTTGAVNDDGLAAALEWGSGGGGDQGFFDLAAAVDPAYWSDPSHWTDNNDQSLNYLP